MGVPADVYGYGGTYILASVSILVTGFVTVSAFIPVYHALDITSTYEYLGMRFDDRTRMCATLLFTLAVFIHIPIIAYVASLSFSAGKRNEVIDQIYNFIN